MSSFLVSQEIGLVGIGLVDSFGDLVPPRAMDAERDGAMGWYKREGKMELYAVGSNE